MGLQLGHMLLPPVGNGASLEAQSLKKGEEMKPQMQIRALTEGRMDAGEGNRHCSLPLRIITVTETCGGHCWHPPLSQSLSSVPLLQ